MKKYKYNLNTFHNKDAVTYYLLGAFLTDGCVYRGTASLTSKDKDWLEAVNRYICPEKPILNHGAYCYRLQYHSIELVNWLVSQRCIPNKSLVVQMPDIPNEYIFDFLRGCWDGDGNLCFAKSANKGKNFRRAATLTSSSKVFAYQIRDLLSTLGITNYIETRPHIKGRKILGRPIVSGHTNYRIHISNGKNVYDFVKAAYARHDIAYASKINYC